MLQVWLKWPKLGDFPILDSYVLWFLPVIYYCGRKCSLNTYVLVKAWYFSLIQNFRKMVSLEKKEKQQHKTCRIFTTKQTASSMSRVIICCKIYFCISTNSLGCPTFSFDSYVSQRVEEPGCKEEIWRKTLLLYLQKNSDKEMFKWKGNGVFYRHSHNYMQKKYSVLWKPCVFRKKKGS